MVASNFSAALAFVWAPGRDSPKDGYHSSVGDPGGGTFGGIIETTWANAMQDGLVAGSLKNASITQLSLVIKRKFWDQYCAELPKGLDLLVFNGIFMSGRFPELLQQCLGFTDGDVDGSIGKFTKGAIADSDPETLIKAIHGVHDYYLRTLQTWGRFGAGWEKRLEAARDAALALAESPS